jgi:uncharacterized SAM-binding protein YcdF (DUF218 family)
LTGKSKNTKVMKKRVRKSIIVLAVTVVVALLFLWLVMHAGTFLIKQTPPGARVDAAVILMGSIADRVLEAADVYNAGLTHQLVIVNNIQYGSEALEPYGVHIPNFAELSVDALQQLNIPGEDIIHLPGRAASTRDEADTIASWLRIHPQIKSLALISSSAHTRRAAMIFTDSFKDHNIEVKLISIPSKYSEFDGERWWRDRESAKQVFMEWVKIVSFVTVERWSD